MIFKLRPLTMFQESGLSLPVLNAFYTQAHPVLSDWTDKILHDMLG